MFDDLTGRFEKVFKSVRGRGKLSEQNITEAVKSVKMALLEADVNYKVVKNFVSKVKEQAMGRDVLESITPGQQFVKVVHEALVELLGSESEERKYHTNRVNRILLSGLQGSGKTTTCAKLGLYFRKQGHRPLVVACDTHRPAAIDQLETLGKSLNIPVHSDRESTPSEICRDALKRAKREDYSMVLIDTAGRLHIDSDMMGELKDVASVSEPDDILFVADAMTGQDAVNVAKEFHKEISFSGVVLTKMDGDARGGAALSIREVTGVPVKYVGVGEKPDALEQFHPDRMASRILGMGDIVSLVEKAESVQDTEKDRKLQKKIRRNAFSLQDFLDQLRKIKKMGSLQEIIGMIPGMGSQLKDADMDESALTSTEAIICSMTRLEREKPKIIDGSRRRRIARGSGRSVQEVNRLLKQYESMKKMMKKANKIAGKRGAEAAMKNMMPQ
ncbi:MAG: signal recognition particle protein [Chitinivibrionales bacterium]